jgi:hypothetical protein
MSCDHEIILENVFFSYDRLNILENVNLVVD